MDCKLTSLQDELLKYLPEGDKAQKQYNVIFTEGFKEWYGDWQAPDFDRNYLNEEGEPLLHKGGIFYSALDKTHLSVVKDKFANFSASEIEDITGKLAYEIITSGKILDFAGDLTGETANIQSIIKNFILAQATNALNNRKKHSEGSKEWEKYNEELKGLALIKKSEIAFRENVLEFLESRGVKTKSKKTEELEQEVVDELETLESEALEAVESDGLNLTESFRKNSKDNATANIKLLLSFLPKIEITEDNKFVYEKSSYLNGTSFEDFNHVFNKLQDELSNLVTLNGENGKVLDMFDLMLEKVGDLSATMPVMAVLKERLRELPEYKKTEFVQTFSMSKYDFITTLVSGKEGNRVVKVGTAQQFSASDIIIDAWNVGFEETSSINISTGKFDSSLIVEQLESLNKIKKDLESKKIDSVKLKGAIEDRILDAFKAIGITPNKKAFMAYMGADSAGNIETGEFKNKFTSILNAFIRLSNIKDDDIYDEDRNMNNVLKDVMGNVLKDLAKEQAKFEPSLTEATVLGKDGNQFWEYSKPSMMHSLLSQIHRGDYSLLDELLGQPYAKGSRWLNHIDSLRRQGKTEAIKNIKISTFLQFKEEGKGDQGEDSKSISMPDLLADTINKTLNHRKNNPKEGIRNHNSINSTMTAADKSQQHHMEGMPAIKSNISGNPSDVKFYNKEVVETFKDYLRDELRRYAKAHKELNTLPKEELILYYHTDKDGNVRDEDSLLGNAFNIYSFPGILEAVPGILNSAKEVITDSQGEPLLPDAVDAYVKEALSDKIVKTYYAAKKYHIVKEDGSNNAIDKTILDSYSGSHKTFAAIADFTINSLVSNIEGTKMFNGDPGFYKNPADFLKRIPASYINGLTLRLGIKDAEGKLLKDNDHEFKVAVLAAVETNPSAYLDSITKAFKDAGYSKEDIDDLKKAYVGVNVTDAQGYITPDRFKFLMERLGKGTTPEWNRIYEKATTKVDGKWQQLTPEEFKTLSAQPLKGVYFGQKNGMPTYLKYSQAVLWPSFVEGSALENLKNKMEAEKVDEAVVTDGIKVGLVQPQTVHDAENNLRLPDIPLNTITLDNRNWRLQQDLPNKGIKQTLLGSQLQKNILANISLGKEYGDMLGQNVVDELNKTIAELSNRGVEEVLENFKVDKDGNVDRSVLDEVIIKELKEKGGADNLIKAIERGVQYDALFQHRDKIQNILFSHINKRVVDIATNGGSFIQMAPFGITEKLADHAGVKWLVEKSELKPPLKNKDGSISRGQVLIPHNQIVKHIPNYRNMSLKDLNAAIDPEALKLIGYRIPNQGMSSNDALEVAGILPPEMGDMVVAYGEITAKTGSDYDIDKMYMMIPHIELVNGVVKRVQYDDSLNEEASTPVETVSRYSNTDVAANPDKIYVFGDNTQRKGTGGQAQIRNNENAFGIATKLQPNNSVDAFMSDNDLQSNKDIIDSDIAKIKADGRPVVFPKDGFGTGLAKLKEKAPKTYDYLKQRLQEEFGFNNDTGEISIPKIKIKDEVNEFFKSNPELANIGTVEEYSQYLDTIFPDSKVKDILYHGTDKEFDTFDKTTRGKNTGSEKFEDGTLTDSMSAFFFTDNVDTTDQYSFINRLETIKNIGRHLSMIGYNSSKKSIEKLKKLSPELHASLKAEQAKGTNMKEHVRKLAAQYQKVDKDLGEGFLNQLNNFKLLKRNLDNLRSKKSEILQGNYVHESGTSEYPNLSINLYENDLGTNIKADGFISSFNKKFQNKNITSLSSEEFDDLLLLGENSYNAFLKEYSIKLKKAKLTPKLLTVKVNITNPLKKDFKGLSFVNQSDTQGAQYEASKLTAKAVKEGNDSVIFENIKDPYLATNYGIFESHQIHILGSKQDIEGFKEFANDTESSAAKEQTSIDKNSKQALQNKLISLYDKVLTDPKTYAALMSSIDAEFMKDDIKSLLPNEGKSDLDLFDSIKQLELKIDLMSGKAGVGQTANQLTDHALTQIADFKLNEYLGVGLTDEKGHTVFNQVKSEKVPGRDPKDITVVMSAFLNAYVDIAKDPYVVQGNHNTFTANTVFMLLRAGVDYQWVNAFIAQPILKDLVNETFNGKGRMALKQKGPQGGYLSALEVVKKKWEEKVGGDYDYKKRSYNKISSIFKDISPLEYLKDTAKNPNSADPRHQLDVLTMFEGWKDISKSLRDSVIASKNDVNGAGYDLISKQIIENMKGQVLNDSRLTNFSNKFKMNGKNTALGTFYDNSVGLANLITNNMFITDSIGFRRILNEFSIELGQGVLTNRDLGKKLEKEIFAYLYSQTDLQMQDEAIIPMFRGKNSVANNVSRLKEHKRYKNNPLIKHLQIKKGHKKDGYSYVTISNTKNQPKYFKDLLYKGWLELLEDPELRPFAEKLVRYSYYSSGFKKGIGSIFEHIPNEWIFGNGINDRMKAWKNILNNDEVLEDLKVQVYKHMWADNTIVPSVSKHVPKKLPKNISANNAGHGTDIIFTIPEFVGKYKKNDQWPRFVTRKIGSTDYLYRLAGTVKNDSEKKTEHAVYVRSNKLGYSKKGKTIVEYGNDSRNSIFPENVAIKESNVYNAFRKNLRFVYDKVTPPKTVVPEMSVVEPFVIDHQEMLNKAEARKKNCK